jgi:hypothetical protein
MSEAPTLHPDVPAGAIWNPQLEKWEVCRRDAAGVLEGELHLYRPDGTLYLRTSYTQGVEDGPFAMFHPDGKVAREGRHRLGQLAGTVTAFAGEGEGAEPLRSCCVPENAAQMRSEYEGGQLLRERFLDRQGRVLLSDGTPRPDPPAALAAIADADYDETAGRWVVPPRPGTDELWRAYGQDGRLEEQSRIEQGYRTFLRAFAPDGAVKEETSFNLGGRRHGPYRRRYLEGEPSPYLDARIVEERGAFAEDHPVGRWAFLDAAGAAVREVDRGQCLTDDELGLAGDQRGGGHAIFADEDRTPEDFAALAEALVAEGRGREALCAAARAAGRRGEADELVAFLARRTVALHAAAAAELAAKASETESGRVNALLSALVAGGDPAVVLQALSSEYRHAPRAGRDFAEAAVLLAPDRPAAYFARGLVRLELGDDLGVLADAGRVHRHADEAAALLREYARVLFPEWAFWPLRERLSGEAGELPAAPAQPLAAIRYNVQVYATRLRGLREAVRRWIGPRRVPAWLPPELEALLPDGPVPLRRYTATITDETDEGPEQVEVEIDETLDPARAAVPALMRAARAQWAGLTWLCWSAGLTRVVLPEALAPPTDFALGAAAAITRFFRAQDVVQTGGLRSLNAGVPGFVWEGSEIDQTPKHLVDIAVDEYYELRALFLWLMSPENISPFQSDLRQV